METVHTEIRKRPVEIRREKPINKILLIDSSSTSSLSTDLARQAHHVIHCNRVQKAWNFVYPHPPDLIVFNLREFDDRSLADLHECRALAGRVPIIVATSLFANPDLLKALPRGTAAVVAYDAAAQAATETLSKVKARMAGH